MRLGSEDRYELITMLLRLDLCESVAFSKPSDVHFLALEVPPEPPPQREAGGDTIFDTVVPPVLGDGRGIWNFGECAGLAMGDSLVLTWPDVPNTALRVSNTPLPSRIVERSLHSDGDVYQRFDIPDLTGSDPGLADGRMAG